MYLSTRPPTPNAGWVSGRCRATLFVFAPRWAPPLCKFATLLVGGRRHAGAGDARGAREGHHRGLRQPHAHGQRHLHPLHLSDHPPPRSDPRRLPLCLLRRARALARRDPVVLVLHVHDDFGRCDLALSLQSAAPHRAGHAAAALEEGSGVPAACVSEALGVERACPALTLAATPSPRARRRCL